MHEHVVRMQHSGAGHESFFQHQRVIRKVLLGGIIISHAGPTIYHSLNSTVIYCRGVGKGRGFGVKGQPCYINIPSSHPNDQSRLCIFSLRGQSFF